MSTSTYTITSRHLFTFLLFSLFHHLLPPPRDSVGLLLSRLRALSKCPRIQNETKKYQPLISSALHKYQTSKILVTRVQ